MIPDEIYIPRVKDYRERLLTHPVKNYSARPYSDIRYIAVHHSQTTSGSAESFARYHVNKNNWPGIGYHYVIEKNGDIKWCNNVSLKTYHVGNSNRYAIGICLTGDFHTQKLEKRQLDSLLRVIKALMKEFHIEANNVWGHNQFPDYGWKKCPCIDMESVRLLLKKNKKDIIKPDLDNQENISFHPETSTIPSLLINPDTFLMKPGETIFSFSDRIGLFEQGDIRQRNITTPHLIPAKEPTPVKAKGNPEKLSFELQNMIITLEKRSYKVFKSDIKPYNLNIVGIRNDNSVPNSFDDELWVFWKYDNIWTLKKYQITTDPGLTYLEYPINESGTAILKEGQYRNAYKIGKHRNKYTALVQAKPVTVIRDFNRDSKLDFNSGKEQTGMFGINIHRSSANGESTLVNKWSAGCQVFSKISQYNEFIKLCKLAQDYWGNFFTYTLINKQELNS